MKHREPRRLFALTAELAFPHPSLALDDPNGLLAIGGDLSIDRLLLAYQNGIFPWYSDGEPIMWWSPDPRAVIFPGTLHVSKSLAKFLKKSRFDYTMNQAFPDVIEACRAPRAKQRGTWITDEMKQAYLHLHQLGYAQSLECWQQGKLVGGIYGVTLGKCFFGESMFSRVANASKAVLVELDRWLSNNHYRILDCQVSSPHLSSMGAVEIPRASFLELIAESTLTG